MFFMLLDVDLDMSVDIPLSEMATSLFEAQLHRMTDNTSRDAFGRRAAARLESALLECVDWDLRPPTPAQINYATLIARTVGIDLPREVLQQRGAMHLFLAKHSGTFKNNTIQRGMNGQATPTT